MALPAKWYLPALQLLSLLFVALALIPAGAHLFELPNKLALTDRDYLLVQQVYRGWWLFGLAVIPALFLTLAHAIAVRERAERFVPALGAFLCMLATQVIFWIWTQPANRATSNWTEMPEAFDRLRAQWEYSHAAAALFALMGFALLAWSIVDLVGAAHARRLRPRLIHGRTVYRDTPTIRSRGER
jgi:hypothetical protein